MSMKWIVALLSVFLWLPAISSAQDSSRGELLYTTHCIACHNSKIHWRDNKIATDWTSLNTQVRHWQQVTGLGWNDADIVEVAHYLNVLHYHYSEPGK